MQKNNYAESISYFDKALSIDLNYVEALNGKEKASTMAHRLMIGIQVDLIIAKIYLNTAITK